MKRQRMLPISVQNLLALYSFGCFWVDSTAFSRQGEDWISIYRVRRGRAKAVGDFRVDGKPAEDLIEEIKVFLDWVNGVT